ncbi:hypothetical protein SCLCIDRAFT_1223299 [Scleroderma citrinum Foug A]|uniref:Uncharacterized protein n=1 Tax=Scleroderma citrinum Foug A TaxID=1036808 RepID=A0A0C3CWM2_9AGAM|nr:hypothetical protein SCLCIDRAFT_1223299 [Scleroderma citrinum Foug A]
MYSAAFLPRTHHDNNSSSLAHRSMRVPALHYRQGRRIEDADEGVSSPRPYRYSFSRDRAWCFPIRPAY